MWVKSLQSCSGVPDIYIQFLKWGVVSVKWHLRILKEHINFVDVSVKYIAYSVVNLAVRELL